MSNTVSTPYSASSASRECGGCPRYHRTSRPAERRPRLMRFFSTLTGYLHDRRSNTASISPDPRDQNWRSTVLHLNMKIAINFMHIHLVLTHFPPVLSLGGAAAATAGLFLRRHGGEVMRPALLLLIVAGVTTPLAYFARNRAPDQIGSAAGLKKQAIAPPQNAAT